MDKMVIKLKLYDTGDCNGKGETVEIKEDTCVDLVNLPGVKEWWPGPEGANPARLKYSCKENLLTVGSDEKSCETSSDRVEFFQLPTKIENFGDVAPKKCIAGPLAVAFNKSFEFSCESPDSSEGGLSGGEIAGIVVGSVAGLLLLVYIYYRFYKKGMSNKGKKKK